MAPVKYTYPGTTFEKKRGELSEDGLLTVPKSHHEDSKHPEFLPTWDLKEFYKPLEFFEHKDPGSRADPELQNLFPKDSKHELKNVTPKLGTEVTGIQLSQLDDKAKDDLALFVAKRGLVIFRDQDFSSKGPQFVSDYGKHFGPLHIHPTTGSPKGHSEIHVVYRRNDYNEALTFANRTNLVQWHSDVSYELQPPGTTFFSVIEGPESGGDTLFADTVEAYNRLSPRLKELIEGLHVLHSSEEQAKFSRKEGGAERRDPVRNVHPLVRVHPVTGDKILYVNPGFSRKIVEFKQEESDALLNFLYNHIGNSHDLQARVNWEPNSVVVWDNRRVSHTAIIDWDSDSNHTRHAFRVTPQAERPIADIKDLNKRDENRHIPKDSI